MRYERWHRRDLIYSLWHRNLPDYCKAIDADWIEFCHNCSMPLAGIEVALDVGQAYKPTTVTRNLGLLSNRPTYLTLYTPAEEALEHHKDPQHMPEKHPVEYYKDAI